jgi:hypothetical protein
MLFIAGVIVFVLCLAGDFIATLPGHPDWFDLIGLDDLAWRLMIFGALGILAGGGIMAWNLIRPGDRPQPPQWPVNRWKKSE